MKRSRQGETHEARVLAEAREITDEIEQRCRRLAPELTTPPHARDPEKIRALWLEINGLRPALLDVAKRMRQSGGPPRARRKGSATAEARAFRAQRRVLASQLQAWSAMADMVARHIEASPHPLMPEVLPTADPLMLYLASTLHKVANPADQSADSREHGAYADIAMPVRKFDTLMQAVYRLVLARGTPAETRFCDIGCGGGTTLLMARRYFGHCTGIEYDARYAENARFFMNQLRERHVTIDHADALTYEDYGTFDVIYFYRPLRTDEALVRLEQQILAQAKPGTLVIGVYDHFLKTRKMSAFAGGSDPDEPPAGLDTCPLVVPPIYAVGLSQEEADLWRDDAERTGTTIIPHPEDNGFRPGFWTPLLEASRYALNS